MSAAFHILYRQRVSQYGRLLRQVVHVDRIHPCLLSLQIHPQNPRGRFGLTMGKAPLFWNVKLRKRCHLGCTKSFF